MGAKPDSRLYQPFPMLGRERGQIWSYAPKYRRPRHFHSEPELNLVVAGRTVLGVGASTVEIRAGEILSLPPGHEHIMLSASEDLQLLAVGLEPQFAASVLRDSSVRACAPLLIRPSAEEFQTLVSRASAAVGLDHAEQHVAEIWERVHLSTQGAVPTGAQNLHILTRRTLQAISEDPNLGRDDLARLSRANPSEISRYFHRDVGMTLVQYKTRQRLMRFIREVDARGKNLSAAAYEAGFGSYSQCHRAFQAEFGGSPKRFFFSGWRESMEQAFEPFASTRPRSAAMHRTSQVSSRTALVPVVTFD